MTSTQLEQAVAERDAKIRDLCACLNAAIRIVRIPGLWEETKAEQRTAHWAEQVKQGMALIAGAPDYLDRQQLLKECKVKFRYLLETGSLDHMTIEFRDSIQETVDKLIKEMEKGA